MEKTYCIKSGYQHKTSVANTAFKEGESYWNEHRIETSNYYQHSVYTFAVRLAKEKFGDTFTAIDVGCGSGNKLMSLVASYCKDVSGVDQAYIMEKAKNKYPTAKWYVNDLDNPDTPLTPGQTFDLVICSDVIEHLLDPDILLTKLKAVMSSRSILVLSTPERDILRGKNNQITPHPEHIREWNSAELRNYLEANGLVVSQMKNLHAMKPHFGILYFNFLRRLFGRTNYCMTAVCSLSQK